MTKPIPAPDRASAGWGTAARAVYAVAMALYVIVSLPTLVRKGKLSRGLRERLGRPDEALARALRDGRPTVWIHAVSVGEVALAFRLGEALGRLRPDLRRLYTVTTVTGREVAERSKKAGDLVCYCPVDLGGSVGRFLEGWRPHALVLLETEIWPELIRGVRRAGAPVCIVNARLSDKALPGYRKVRRWLAPVLAQVELICAQSQEMAARYIGIGARPGAVRVTGNLKYDWAPTDPGAEWSERMTAYRRSDAYLLLAASTHEGEEQILFEMYGRLKAQYPCFQMAVAPRHPERLSAVARVADRSCGGHTLFSERRPDPGRPLIVDRMGVLGALYPAADVVFVGGSLVPVGGHNPIEPASYGKAVLFGPSMVNFKTVAGDFLRAGAAIQVADAAELEREVLRLVQDPAARQEMGRRASDLVRAQKGALDRTVESILAFGAGARAGVDQPLDKGRVSR
ncbi:MAG: 3-deoxy-D-manno-octulosonic acid transferase [Candidatus Omnitrophica bacterium]|nr:3-deoxy-D-manno-octulosonic acid transferase [Candidatus Omnitrophota bacterium]